MQLTTENTRLRPNRSGFWEIRWTERNEAGVPVTRSYSCRTKDRREADAFRDAWLAAGQVIENHSSDKTVDQMLDDYVELHLELNSKAVTQTEALTWVRRKLGGDTLLTLTGHRIAEYTRERRKMKAGISDGTIRRELGALRAALAWNKKKGLLPKETILPDIELPAAPGGRETYLTQEEEERLWGIASGLVYGKDRREQRIGLFVCLALETAARSRSIETLVWSRVNLGTRLIDYREPGVRVTKKRRVPVPISDRLLPVLTHAEAKKKTLYVLGGSGSTKKAFNALMDKHGFDVTRHDLRRTWATLRAQWGVSLFDIAGVLGDTMETVTKHYAHHCPDYLRGAVNHRPSVPEAGTGTENETRDDK